MDDFGWCVGAGFALVQCYSGGGLAVAPAVAI